MTSVANRTDALSLFASALEEVAGPAIVLDASLRVIGATVRAERLIGMPIEYGVAAPKLLCGSGPERPMAEALAAGKAVTTELWRPTEEGSSRTLTVRASPLWSEGVITGWLLLLEEDPWQGSTVDQMVDAHGIITRDPGMKVLLRMLAKVAQSDATVLVRGETGTGKELVARAIHSSSPRAAGPFRAINCAALPPHLLDSELFGHVRGAFTGAVRDADGHIRMADGGTLFLDEVAELSLDLQAKLLRVLQERTVIPVGGRDPLPVDVRIVSATHRSLRQAVEDGEFRADLMFRLRVVPLFLPSLRERPADTSLLAWRFVEVQNAKGKRKVARIGSGALRLLEDYDWPGNVRELQNVIEYAFVMGDGPVMTEADFPAELFHDSPIPGATLTPPARRREEGSQDRATVGAQGMLPREARRIVHALERAHGHRGRAARSLGISRVTLWRKMKQFNLDDDDTPS